jgi:hypothetical protein
MSDEKIAIEITDNVAGSIQTKIRGIADESRSAFTAVEKLKAALASVSASSGTAKLQTELNKTRTASTQLEAAVAKTAQAQAVAATAAQRLATEQQNTATAAAKAAAAQAAVTAALSNAAAAQDRAAGAAMRLQAAQDRQAASAAKQAAASAAAGTAEQQHAAMLEQLRMKYNPLFAASKQYETALRDIAAAETLGAISAREATAARERAAQAMAPMPGIVGKYGAAVNSSSGYTANLASQFNDIGVMLAAGQNPLQLALQQGTQISQVLNQIAGSAGGGAVGALKALGAGFLSMINPISIATIAIIAFGAMFFQWLMKLIPETVTLKDRMDNLSKSVADYTHFAEIAGMTTAELQKKFGTVGVEIQKASKLLQDFTQQQAIADMSAALKTLSEEFGGFSKQIVGVSRSGGMGMSAYQQTVWNLRTEFELTKTQAEALTQSLANMSNAATPQAAVQASADFAQQLVNIYGTTQQIPPELLKMAIAAQKVAESGGGIVATQQAQLQAVLATAAAQAGAWAKDAIERLKARVDANALIKSYQDQAAMVLLVAQYGENSVQVTKARQAAEMAVLAEQVKGLNVTQDVKQAILDAAGATDATINATNAWAGAMANVANQVRGILSALANLSGTVIANASRQVEIDALKAGKSVADARLAGARDEIERETTMRVAGAQNIFEKGLAYLQRGAEMRALDQQTELTELQTVAAARDRAAAGSGGSRASTAATAAEKEAKKELNEQLKREQDLLDATFGKREEFIKQVQTLSALMHDPSKGFGQNEALSALAQTEISAYLDHLPEMLNARVAEFGAMYEQIDLLRQNDLISEQSAKAAKIAIWADEQKAKTQIFSNFFGGIAQLSSSKNKELARIGKAAAITQTIINTYQGATAAYASMAAIPVVGPALGIAAAAAAVAGGLANVAAIRAQGSEGYMSGGYTGNGARHEIAGSVHGREYVMDAATTSRIGVADLNALRSGAATVQRDAPNAGQAAAAPSATASGATLNARIINMIDPAMVGDYLATPEGEQVIVNVMHRNADTFKAFQNG